MDYRRVARGRYGFSRHVLIREAEEHGTIPAMTERQQNVAVTCRAGGRKAEGQKCAWSRKASGMGRFLWPARPRSARLLAAASPVMGPAAASGFPAAAFSERPVFLSPQGPAGSSRRSDVCTLAQAQLSLAFRREYTRSAQEGTGRRFRADRNVWPS